MNPEITDQASNTPGSLPTERQSKRRFILMTLCVAVAALSTSRFLARQAAVNYGQHFSSMFSMLSPQEFKNTASLREFLDGPDFSSRHFRAQILSFAGGGYSKRITEFKQGIIYYSEQYALPQDRRFTNPPKLELFPIQSSDTSDAAIKQATVELILNFRQSVL